MLLAQSVRGIIRTGPTLSSTQPNWKVGLACEYAVNQLSFGVGVDMVVSQRLKNTDNHGDMLLNVFGFFAEVRTVLSQSKLWRFHAGTGIGARTVVYEKVSNTSFNPFSLIPPESPLGTTKHFVVIPFVQIDYVCASWVDIIGRVGYDVHVGPDYVDVSATTLSGPAIQIGARIVLSGS